MTCLLIGIDAARVSEPGVQRTMSPRWYKLAA